jgi:hypothetical protein
MRRLSDLHRRGCFVLEATQGNERAREETASLFPDQPKKGRKGTAVRGTKGWDDAMLAARGQVEAVCQGAAGFGGAASSPGSG